jgi:long-chain acyl-CoA synthetase
MAKTRSLALLLDEHPTEPGAAIVHAAGVVTTRAELDTSVRRIAESIETLGLAGATTGVSMPNSAIAIASWFAIWRTGGTVVPLNPRVPAGELERLADSAGVAAVLTTTELADRFAGDALTYDPVVVKRTLRVAGGASDGRIALVQFTSGTTGRPKPVPLEHETILALLDPVIESLRKNPNRKAPMPNLIPVSLSLWAGIYNVLFAFRVGAPVVLMDRFEPVEFARLVDEFAIKSSVLPPAALVMLLEEAAIESLGPLRYVRSVSAPLSPYQARRFHDRFGVAVLNGYGQTELGAEAVGWSADDWRTFGASKLGSVGRPHSSMRVRVCSDDGDEVPVGEVGEIQIQPVTGPPPASRGLADRITDDGWLRTGDLGRIDEDGFVWVEGRKSAMINRGGLKVFPDEVEEVVRSHPALVDAAVVGVPDDRLGEVPHAFVVAAEAGPGLDVDLEAIRTWARDRLAPYKVPVAFTLVRELPRNDMGKVLRSDLVARAQRGEG